MNTRAFFDVVPTTVKRWACIPVVGAVVISLAMGAVTVADHHASLWTIPLYGAAGLLSGIVCAAWLLGLGFVFADARRRAMRPVLWVLVCILFPHLLGFLLYFVLRQPLALPCSHCGQPISSGHQFCSWCGGIQTSTPADSASPQHS